ncbi:MAG: DUF4332 domain-containing protein [Cyanobacteria bacterium REEB65]|nr:DUF4332 domain-containing protein [Cyanobacteria bacterium REEB65]
MSSPGIVGLKSSALPSAGPALAAKATATPASGSSTTHVVSQGATASIPPTGDLYALIPNANDLASLLRWGISTPDRLAFWGGGPIRRSLLSWVTGIPAPTLCSYAQTADLCQVPGMQAQWALELHACGITGPVQLARYGGSSITASIQQDLLFAMVASEAVQLTAATGRPYMPPGPGDLAALCEAALGLPNKVS